MKLFTILALIFSINLSFSQAPIGEFSTREYHNVENLYYSEYTNEITGNLYLFENWKQCIVNTNLKEDGLSLELQCNYNLFTDQFEMNVDNEVQYLKKENIISIEQGDKIFKPIKSPGTEDSRNYMEILASGKKYYLASIYYLKIKDIPNKRSLGIFKKNISKHNKLYLVDRSSGKFIEVPNSRRAIYNLLNLKKDEIKKISGNIKKLENLKKAVEMT